MTTYKWQFAPRFRRNAFGWKSDTPIQRIKEAVSEIKAVARKAPVLAAEGAVLFLEKLAPALLLVDSSSGALGSAVAHAIDTLAPIIAKAEAPPGQREQWLERLFKAIEDDDMPYLEYLGEFWGDLCATPQLASRWADTLAPDLTALWDRCARSGEFDYSHTTTVCLSALFASGRHDALLALIARSEYNHPTWAHRVWGARALVAAGRHAEAIRYAEGAKGLNTPVAAIAQFCEGVLLASGQPDEAYARYALDATQATTHLATFRAIAKKYPDKAKETILRDLVAHHPGKEGKWFAAAKDAGLYELAIELVERSPADPKTLIRAARDFAQERPDFAVAAGLAGLRHLAAGVGYDMTSNDVREGYAAVTRAAAAAGLPATAAKAELRALVAGGQLNADFIGRVLARELAQ